MSAAAALLLMQVLAGYAAIGLVVGAAFAWGGALRLAAHAVRGTWGFRLMILPGAALLWPLVLVRWMRGPRPEAPDDAPALAFGDPATRHRRAVLLLLLGAPLALALGAALHRARPVVPMLPGALSADEGRRP